MTHFLRKRETMGRVKNKLELCLIILVLSGCPFSSSEDPTIADPETTTPKGCKCTSLCGATIEDGFTVSYSRK